MLDGERVGHETQVAAVDAAHPVGGLRVEGHDGPQLAQVGGVGVVHGVDVVDEGAAEEGRGRAAAEEGGLRVQLDEEEAAFERVGEVVVGGVAEGGDGVHVFGVAKVGAHEGGEFFLGSHGWFGWWVWGVGVGLSRVLSCWTKRSGCCCSGLEQVSGAGGGGGLSRTQWLTFVLRVLSHPRDKDMIYS